MKKGAIEFNPQTSGLTDFFSYGRFIDWFCACLWMTLFHHVLFNNKTWSIRLTLESDFDTLPNRNKKRRQQDETTRLILVIAQISRRARIEYSDLFFSIMLKSVSISFCFVRKHMKFKQKLLLIQKSTRLKLKPMFVKFIEMVLKCFFSISKLIVISRVFCVFATSKIHLPVINGQSVSERIND